VVAGVGASHLETLMLADLRTGRPEEVPATTVFVLIGAGRRTDWLGCCGDAGRPPYRWVPGVARRPRNNERMVGVGARTNRARWGPVRSGSSSSLGMGRVGATSPGCGCLHRRAAAAARGDRRHDQLVLTRAARLHRGCRGGPSELGVASDVFALGLIYAEYLTGAPPPFDVARYHEPAVAVRSGETLRIPRHEIPTQLADVVDVMLSADPARRPAIGEVHAILMNLRLAPEDEGQPHPASALRGKGLRTAVPRPGAPSRLSRAPGREARA
jgi:hypothetical protein